MKRLVAITRLCPNVSGDVRGGWVITCPNLRTDFRFTPSQWETALLCNDASDPIRLEIKNFSKSWQVELFWPIFLLRNGRRGGAVYFFTDFTVHESCLNFWLKSNIGLQLETAVSRDVNAYLLFINPIFFYIILKICVMPVGEVIPKELNNIIFRRKLHVWCYCDVNSQGIAHVSPTKIFSSTYPLIALRFTEMFNPLRPNATIWCHGYWLTMIYVKACPGLRPAN